MSDITMLVGGVSLFLGVCCCLGVAASLQDATAVTIQVTRNPVHSAPEDPEDPVDFSSKPKSSETSLGS
jgi:hypothetical protein